MVAVVLMGLIIIFDNIGNNNILDTFYSVASYTYGPLLGMFAFGICSRRKIRDSLTPAIAIASPLLCLLLQSHAEEWFGGYRFGFEILIIKALLTMMGLALISRKKQ